MTMVLTCRWHGIQIDRKKEGKDNEATNEQGTTQEEHLETPPLNYLTRESTFLSQTHKSPRTSLGL